MEDNNRGGSISSTLLVLSVVGLIFLGLIYSVQTARYEREFVIYGWNATPGDVWNTTCIPNATVTSISTASINTTQMRTGRTSRTTFVNDTMRTIPANQTTTTTAYKVEYNQTVTIIEEVNVTGAIISIGDYSAGKGDVVVVDVLINGSRGIAGGSVEVRFDPSVVLVESVSDGDFGRPVMKIDNDIGLVRIAVASYMPVEKTTALLARIKFLCRDYGSTILSITFAELNDEHGMIFKPDVKNGSITVVSSPLKGDVNGNGKLDPGDATLILRMVVGLEPMNMSGDMNGNGRIDPGDATIVLRRIVGLE